MKDFIKKLQGDLGKLQKNIQNDVSKLQKTLEKEGSDLINKVRSTAQSIAKSQKLDQRTKDLEKKAKEIEKLINQGIKNMEPRLLLFITGIRKNADKYGIDLSSLERNLKAQVRKVTKKTGTKKKAATAKKTSTAASKKAPVRKKTATKAPAAAKKKTSKSSAS